MYYPRIKLDANSFAALGSAIRQARLEAVNSNIDSMEGVIKLPQPDKYRITPEQRVTTLSNGSVKLTRLGDKGILTGTVSSAEEAEQLKILLSFEPGIYEIEDRLTVR
jgi:Tfp pilus assembly protein FimT